MRLKRLYRKLRSEEDKILLKEKEKIFLQYACSELSYKEIASLMNVGARTVDGYRETLFKKFNVQTRVGLILEAIRRDLVDL